MSIFKVIRAVTKPIILLAERMCNAAPVERTEAEQAEVDRQTAALAIYEYRGCPFCMKTRRVIKRLSLNIELRDAKDDPEHRQALLEQGGKTQVPCLRIQGNDGDTWMYESSDIIHYLEERFDKSSVTEQNAQHA